MDKPLNFIANPPELLYVIKSNLSLVNFSVIPFSVISTYLSSSKGKKVSFSSAEIFAVEFDVMTTSNCLFIVKLELVKSILLMQSLGSLV